MSADCTILILTYKGKHHLEFLLPTVEEVVEASSDYKIDVLIVDNGRDEETISFVEKQFPSFKISPSPVNDYLFSLNRYVKEIESPYTYILNDDMKLDRNVLNYSLPVIMADEKLFAVGSNIYDWEGKARTIGVRVMLYEKGWMRNFFVEIPDESIRYTLYGGGGAAVFDTRKYNKLGGFSPLYRPAYGEDCDLGHRAWKKGWPSVLHPKSVMYHREGGTIHEQYESDELTQRVYKNNFLWMIRNVDMPRFLFYFFLFLPLRKRKWKAQNKNLYLAFKMAKPLLKDALKLRKREQGAKMKDKEIMKLLNKQYEPRK